MESYIKVGLHIEWKGVDWIHLAQDDKWRSHMNTIIVFRVPYKTGNFLAL
jgi:hypothetical protein